MSRATIVRFAAYRQYEQVRTEASNAVMGLLAGARMAAHMLQLTEGSDRLLPEIFPKIPHIGRLNLTTNAARSILAAGDTHLGAMAVPYALAIHEDYLKTCLAMLQRGGASLSKPLDDLKLAGQHAEIARVTGKSFTSASLEQIHVLRLMRNCTIHSGGEVSTSLLSRLASWPAAAEKGWVKLAGRSPRALTAADAVEFGLGEVLIALAVTKNLAREATQFLELAVPREVWADILIEDLADAQPTAPAAPDFSRRARGHARFHFAPLQLTDTEIANAIARR